MFMRLRASHPALLLPGPVLLSRQHAASDDQGQEETQRFMDPKHSLIGGKLRGGEWEEVLRRDRGAGHADSRAEINKGKGKEGATRGTGL